MVRAVGKTGKGVRAEGQRAERAAWAVACGGRWPSFSLVESEGRICSAVVVRIR